MKSPDKRARINPVNLQRTTRYVPHVEEESVALLHRVADESQEALASLYERYSGPVFGFVLRRVSDRGLAEEVSADVWLGCWRSAASFRAESKVLTWLLGIASRQIHNHLRGKRFSTVPLDDGSDQQYQSTDDPSFIVHDLMGYDELINALTSLPASLYEVVNLAWLHELPYEEIAEIMNIPIGTVKSRVFRARQLLRENLGGHHG